MPVDWAYEFTCPHTLEKILEVFNQAGPWEWRLRDSYFLGSYMNTRPSDSTHIKLGDFSQGFVSGRSGAGFSVLIRTESQDRVHREQLNATVLGLLNRIDAEDIQPAEAWD
jgi:hypothetical protein